MYDERTIAEIMRQVKNHYLVAEELGYTVLGAFAYGSMNYGYYVSGKSDVDTKVIVLPNPREALFDKPVSKEYVCPDGSHMEVRDIREMMKNIFKQNINFVEILFTDFHWINPKYKHFWYMYFVKNRDRIARYDPRQTVLSIANQAKHTLRQFANNPEPKKLHNAARLNGFLLDYEENVPYKDCLWTEDEGHKAVGELKYKLYEHWENLVNILYDEFEEHIEYANTKLSGIATDEDIRRIVEENVCKLLNFHWRIKNV